MARSHSLRALNGLIPPVLLLLHLCAYAPLAAALTSTTCYSPEGNVTTDAPCNLSAAGGSVCCPSGFYCLNNNLCQDSRYADRFLRGSCTDEKWGVAACPSFCKSEWPIGDEAVYYCGSGKYCCSDANCCNSTEGSFLQLGAPTVSVIAPTLSTTGSVTAATAGASSGSGSASASTTSLSSTASASSTASSSKSSSSHATAIGAGVGVPVGVIIVALVFGVVWLFRRRGRNKNDQARELEAAQRYETDGKEKGGKNGPRQEVDATEPPVELEGTKVDRPEM